MAAKCKACKREVAEHFINRGIALCFTCQCDKVGLGRVLEPNSNVRTFLDKCTVCGAAPSNESRSLCLCPNCLKLVESATNRTLVQLEQNLNRPWLIKSAGRVWGPMSSEEVERGLRAKEIGAFDEVIKPFFHWRYIREEEDFSNLLDELKMNAHAREDTLSITVIENQTEAITEAIRDVRPMSPDDNNAPTNFDYSRMGPPTVQAQKPKIYAAIAGLVAIGAIVIATVNWGSKQRLPETDAEIDSVVREVLFSKSQVEREKSFALLHEAFERKPKSPRLALNLALLHIEQKETVPATRILETLLNSRLPQAHQVEVRNSLALAFIMNGQMERARQELDEVLKKDPENFTTALNLGASYFLSGDLEKSQEFILKALERRPQNGEAVTLFAELAIKDFEKNKSKELASDALNRLREFLPKAYDRKQEALILAASLANRLDQNDKAASYMEQFVQVDPNLSQDHLHDLMTFKEHLYWEHLLNHCRYLASQLTSSPRLSSALGLCHLKANEPLVGREVIEDSLKRAPDDPLVQAVYGYVEGQIGQKDQANASLKRANSVADVLPIASILRGRQCFEDEDYECAEKTWKKLFDKYPALLQAQVGLAQTAIQKDESKEAVQWLNLAEKQSAHYIPLLRLKDDLFRDRGTP
jgi:tetratricopeptide (TPR) repeat protein